MSSPSSPRNRRRFRSHLINGDVRARLVADDLVFALAAALIAIGVLYYISNRKIGDSLFSAHLSIKQTRELLTTGAKAAGLITFAAVLVFGIWSVIDAHRIAGPMHRLHRLLIDIGNGNLSHEISFRKRDEFQEVADAADRMVENYRDRLSTAAERAQEIARVAASDAISPEQAQLLRTASAELTEALSVFRFTETQETEQSA
ncbi:MAG TPA: methyl-accepting chemotaxis protein [Chthonomonadales bacterium]|nr:methyl-accepting chemotaxis protein [Chthonomonadales bacterium]